MSINTSTYMMIILDMYAVCCSGIEDFWELQSSIDFWKK